MSQQRNNDSIGVWWDSDRNCYKTTKPVEILGQLSWINIFVVDDEKRAQNPKLPHLRVYIKPAQPKQQESQYDPPF